MKKIYLFAVVTAIALAACTKTQTTAVSEGNLIRFSKSFVDNVTKADVTNKSIKSFWVFGNYYKTTGSAWVPLFNNVQVNGTATGSGNVWTPAQNAYWVVNENHAFGAYADGTNALSKGVAFDPATKKLTFTDYSSGANDLIAATTGNALKWDGSDEAPAVALTFKHLLSKVKFTFKTSAADTYIMKVTALKCTNAVQTASVDFTDNSVGTWTGDVTVGDAYTFDDIADFAEGGSAESVVRYVIPQVNTNSINVSFTVTLSDDSGELSKGNFTGTLAIPNANTLVAGNSYNFEVTIEPEQVDDTMKPIQFEVTTVEGWVEDEKNNVDTPADKQQ